MPRKSTASQGVKSAADLRRPKPMHYLAEREKAVWRERVNARPPDYFDVGTHRLLAEYCRCAIRLEDKSDEGDIRIMLVLSRSFRMTQQSQISADRAATAARTGVQEEKKPWQDE